MGSSNGSWVNGERVVTRDLEVGDRIEVGGTTLELITTELEQQAPRAPETPTDPQSFRAEFPVFKRFRYLNGGTDGPVPARAAAAAQAQISFEAENGRSGAEHWGNLLRTVVDAPEPLRAHPRLRADGGRADEGHDRRDQHGAGWVPARPRRRDSHHRRGAPGPARAAGGDPRPARLRDQGRPVRRGGERGRPADPAGRVLPRLVDHGQGRRRRCPEGDRRFGSPRRRPGPRRDPRRREGAGVRLLRRARPKVALRPGPDRLPLRPRRADRGRSLRRPGPTTSRSPTRTGRST